MTARRMPLIGILALSSVIAIYTVVWFFWAHIIQNQLNTAWADAPRQGVILSPPAPQVNGFPGRFHITWSGNIRTLDAEVTAPQLDIRLWPIPHAQLEINFPQGLLIDVWKVKLPPDQKIMFHHLSLSFEIPTYIPNTWTKADVQNLVDRGIVYRLTSLAGRGPQLGDFQPVFSGSGDLFFDPNLQPRAALHMTFSHPEQIRDLVVSTIEAPLGKSFAKGAINALTRTDPETGGTSLPLTFRIQDGRVYAGPIQVGAIGMVYWPVVTPEGTSLPSTTQAPQHQPQPH